MSCGVTEFLHSRSYFFFLRLFRKILEWQPEEYLSGLMVISSHSLYFCENICSSSLFMKDIFSIYRLCNVRFFYFHLLKNVIHLPTSIFSNVISFHLFLSFSCVYFALSPFKMFWFFTFLFQLFESECLRVTLHFSCCESIRHHRSVTSVFQQV